MKTREVLEGIRKRDLVLPEFQREYVWTLDQSKQLMSSLFTSYPVGSLLFWKTDDPPELKNVTSLPERMGTIEVILDGQQRLTTLYMLITGEIPPYYTEKDINFDPRDLYFNIDAGDFQYYQPSKMKGNDLWQRVVECFTNPGINVFSIAKQQAQTDEIAFQLAQRYNSNLTKLRQIQEIELPTQVVPAHANITDAISIFDLVNSQGTKLTDAELALTHVTGKWPQARREIKSKIDELNSRYFYFNITFMTRALTAVVTNRALFEHIHSVPKEKMVAGWHSLVKTLDYLTGILPANAFIHSTEDINATNIFIPIIAYLSLHNGHFPDDLNIKKAMHWLYAAHIWSRYASQTDQRLEKDVSIIVRETNPWTSLGNEIIDQRGRIEVKPSDLEGRGTQHPLYRMTYILAKSHAAADWFNGMPLGITSGKYYQLHNHHIFPQSVLYQNGFDPENHLHRKVVNEIANMAFLTADTNRSIANTPPEVYLSSVEEKYPGALVKQFIPMDKALWRVSRFQDFLETRRELIAIKINEYMSSLITVPEVRRQLAISDLIQLGESAALEFKSTLQWDVVRNQVNRELRLSVIKTIAAFLNSEGGTLIIGVEDNGSVFGLQKDFSCLERKSEDGFGQVIVGFVDEYIGADYTRLIKVHFEKINGETICVIDVDKASGPVFTTTPKGKEFFIRAGNTTRALDPEEAHRFIQANWE